LLDEGLEVLEEYLATHRSGEQKESVGIKDEEDDEDVL
jgi:hypothetical protein